MHTFSRLIVLFSVALLAACGTQNSSNASDGAKVEPKSMTKMVFNADSAYDFVAKQVQFGPRVPNSAAHKACGQWLLDKLRQYGASNVVEQHTQFKAYNGTALDAMNISASFNPQAGRRILLLSHWDSRPWADQDPDPARRGTPIDGANDGASGVGVILEIARIMSDSLPSIGVDVLFVDAEDYGTRADDKGLTDSEDSWCLGSQYWAQNPTIDTSKLRFAVLLDMVGGKDAVFPREYFSQYSCSDVVDRIWRVARDSGYSSKFVDSTGTPVIDDHLPLIKAGIPTVDIIETNHPATNSFNPTWHTHADNIDNIDRQSLKAVGQTLINLIYNF